MILLIFPVGGCLFIAARIYDEMYNTTYCMEYEGFDIYLTEEKRFKSLCIERPEGDIAPPSPFRIRLKDEDKSYPIFELPEEVVAKAAGKVFERREGTKDYSFGQYTPGYSRNSYEFQEGQLVSACIVSHDVLYDGEVHPYKIYGTQSNIEERFGYPNHITASTSRTRLIGPFH